MAIVDSVDTSDPYTAVFKLSIAFATFDETANFYMSMPCEGTSGPFDLAQAAIGTGPFIQAMLGIVAPHGPRPRPARRCGATNDGLYEGKQESSADAELPAAGDKLDVLREHRLREGRDYEGIEKMMRTRFDLGRDGDRVEQTIEHLHALAALGFQVAHGTVVDVGSLRPLEPMAARVLPALADA